MIRECATFDVSCHLSSLLGGTAGGVVNDLINGFAVVVEQTAAFIVDQVLSLALSSSSVDLSAPWFTGREGAMVQLMALLLLPLLAAGTVSAIIHQDLGRLARTWLVALPVSVFVTVVATTLTGEALKVADAMTAIVTSGVQINVYHVLAETPNVPGTPPAVAMVMSAVILVGALAVWMELLVRSAAVYVAVFFLPLALAGMVWPSTAHLTRRLIDGLVSLILMKFVIVSTLCLGATAVQSGHGADQVASGTAILLIAAFAPYVLFRMVPVMDAASVGHLQGLSRAPLRMASTASGVGTSLGRISGVASSTLAGLRTGPDPERVGSDPASRATPKERPTWAPEGWGRSATSGSDGPSPPDEPTVIVTRGRWADTGTDGPPGSRGDEPDPEPGR